jgi:hypothetical protein
VALQRAISPGTANRLFPPGSERALYLLRAAWPRAVGEELARRTEVLAVEGKTLRIRVPSGGWTKVLHRLAPRILSRLRDVAGEASPTRLGFTEGFEASPKVAEPGPESPPPSEPAPPMVVEGAMRIADPEIRERFLATAARYLKRSDRNA